MAHFSIERQNGFTEGRQRLLDDLEREITSLLTFGDGIPTVAVSDVLAIIAKHREEA